MSGILVRASKNQFRHAVKERLDYCKIALDENDITHWYALLYNLSGPEDEFIGGEFLVEIKLPEEFPFKPPAFHFLTPTGVFEINTKCCIHIGEYHSQNYSATSKAGGFIMELANGLMCHNQLTNGIGLIKTTLEDKKKCARLSKQWNQKHYKKIIDMIESQYNTYSASWPSSSKEEQNKNTVEDNSPAAAAIVNTTIEQTNSLATSSTNTPTSPGKKNKHGADDSDSDSGDAPQKKAITRATPKKSAAKKMAAKPVRVKKVTVKKDDIDY